jgi:hypothetical protein
MMRWFAVFALTTTLAGCAQPPVWLAQHFDQQDPCQSRAELGRPAGYQIPTWCGASTNRTYIYNTSNQKIGYIK